MVGNIDKGEFLGLTTHRIEALTDGVFAIAMTLLVLSLNLPEITSQESFHDLLYGQVHVFLAYVLSFLLLAVFWIIHHYQFHRIERTDRVLLWINIIILMFVALMPFSTSIVGDYPSEPLAKAFFDMNLFILGLLFYVNWRYASGQHRLIDPNMPQEKIELVGRKSLVIPIVSLVSFVLAFLITDYSSISYLLIPIILYLPYFRGSSPSVP
ncbi:MAG: DUF1211 domain-containing protein [Methanomassiliicoccales archaeon]|nr:DUF1211 domain-containing protein [Methanomassiliicoccales archaeon]NYT14918.1 DUF1211 domain-containing protein [Methanomassiliicoccales archaeon]